MKFVEKLLLLIMATAIVFTMACSEDDEKKDETSSVPSLEGTWARSCFETVNDQGEPEYQAETLTFTSTSVTNTQVFYGDAACTTTQFTINFAGKYTVYNEVTATGGEKAHQIVITADSFTLTPATAEFAGFMDQIFSDCAPFTGGAATDVMPCFGVTAGAPISSDIYYINGSSLQFGDEDTEGEDTYPTTLDTDAYTKQ